MDNLKPVEQPTITQADIEAASSICGLPADPDKIKFDPVVQAFARHRTTSLAAQDGLVEALKVAFWASIQNANGDHKYLDYDSLDEIITAAWTGFEDAALSAIKGDKS